MKKLLLLSMLFSSVVFAQTGVTVSARQYVQRENAFLDRPYGEDDIAYGVYLDMFEGIGGWRVGASYATDLTGAGSADTVITPELTLMGAEGIWQSGVSVLIDYIDDETGTDWSDIYWQFQLGLNIPIGNLVQIGAAAYYPMSDFGDIKDFGFNELDYGLNVRIRF